MAANNYSYPTTGAAPVNLDVNNLNISVPEYVERDFVRFVVSDDVRGWSAIPMKVVGAATERNIVVPLCDDYDKSAEYFRQFARRLRTNIESTPANLVFQRPEGKKAYLSSISYALYDYNQSMPLIRLAAGETEPQIISNQFGTIRGVVVGKVNEAQGYNPFNAEIWDIYNTTATFPDFSASAAEHRFRAFHTRASLQTGPRSNVAGGTIPVDFMPNNFAMTIGGALSASGDTVTTLYDTLGRKSPEDAPAGSTFTLNRHDSIVSFTSNVIEKLIPDNINALTVDVAGGGWFAYLPIYKRLGSQMGRAEGLNYRTIVQMPVKIIIDIRFA